MAKTPTISVKELLEEFKTAYTVEQNIPKNTESVIILTGDTLPVEENLSRIKHAVALLSLLGREVPVIFSGVTEEREDALLSMKTLGVSEKLCHFQDCGGRGVANTKTQFETLATNSLTKGTRNLVLVTNTYHIPRIQRTASKHLKAGTSFVVSSPLDDYKLYNAFLKVLGEIERIIKYSGSGDIALYPR